MDRALHMTVPLQKKESIIGRVITDMPNGYSLPELCESAIAGVSHRAHEGV